MASLARLVKLFFLRHRPTLRQAARGNTVKSQERCAQDVYYKHIKILFGTYASGPITLSRRSGSAGYCTSTTAQGETMGCFGKCRCLTSCCTCSIRERLFQNLRNPVSAFQLMTTKSEKDQTPIQHLQGVGFISNTTSPQASLAITLCPLWRQSRNHTHV